MFIEVEDDFKSANKNDTLNIKISHKQNQSRDAHGSSYSRNSWSLHTIKPNSYSPYRHNQQPPN